MLNDRFKTIPGLTDLDTSGAGGGNRTRIASLEGWSFTTKLRPRNYPFIRSHRNLARADKPYVVEGVGFEPT